ncbi:MAG TPA: hypothetical protein VFB15_12260 [Candidatus Binataceae bacterium]|nr:hypothetical protein [Candidatus Binataceae bacterium]
MAVEPALTFLRKLERGEPPLGPVLVAGPQPFLREYALERLCARWGEQGFIRRSFHLGGSDRLDGLLNDLEGGDLFSPRRMIICRLLRSYRERARSEGDGAEESAGDGKAETALIDACGRRDAALRLMIVVERDNPPIRLRRAVEGGGTLVNCQRPFDNQIPQYAELFARQAGLRLAPEAIQALVSCHGGDLSAIANAVSRAAISAEPGATLEAATVAESGHSRRTPEIFELAGAIARADLVEALALAARAIDTGRDPIEMLAVEVIPQLRRMLIAAELMAARKGSAAVASALGLPPSSATAQRAIDGARQFGPMVLREALRRAAALDAGLKMGLIKDREQALFGFLMALVARAGREVAAG